MKYAKFNDDFLSYFRLDDNGETLVLTDKRGFARAVRLLPYEERPVGRWARTGQSFVNPNKFINFCCSNCLYELDEHIRIEPNFCPNCGADMREGDKER